MSNEEKIDWEAGYAMQDRETMFLLYTVAEGLCRSIDDFAAHFSGPVGDRVKELVVGGFVEETDGRVALTDRGRFVLGDLAEGPGTKGAEPEIRKGSWVISTQPLYIDEGIGIIQQVQGDQAKVEFRPTVFSKPPYRTVSRHLGLDQLRVVKSPWERLRDGDFDENWRCALRTLAARLFICNGDGQLSHARTDLLPHQISVAHKVVVSARRRYLIADEVGLGKTIETGMILYALRQRGEARRVLIVAPAGLTLQWQEEMEDKFGLKFAVYREDVNGPLAFDQIDYLIASVDTLKLDRPIRKGRDGGHKSLVLGAHNWDVVVFDEAHRLAAKTWSSKKTDKTLNYHLAEALQERCRALILLTATPHQGDDSKFQNLVSLLHPNVTFDEFAHRGNGDAVVPFTDLILRNRKSKVTDAEGHPIFKGMDVHPVAVTLRDDGERQFHRKLEAYLREGYGFADQSPGDTRHKAIGFVMTTFQKLAASSTRAIKAALEKRATNLRADADSQPESAHVETDARHQGEAESRRAEQVRQAFVETEVDMLDRLLAMQVPGDAKQREMLEVIESVSRDAPDQRILIFTEYLATQDFLIESLETAYGLGCATYIRGGMTLWEKRRNINEFRDRREVRFLVSTEAGGEGINLQFAHVMVNYDLPWNPFRLAQRYGRLDRYGQSHRVQVFNLQNAGTIEDKVRGYLEDKTKRAAERLTKVTGETVAEIEQGLLGLFDEHLNYEKIYRDGLAKGDIKPSQREIDRAVKRAEHSYEIAYASLFSKDISPFNPDRFKHEVQSPLTLDDVKTLVLEFVRHSGRKVSESSDGLFEFLLPDSLKGQEDLKQRYEKVTFDRAEAIRHGELEFMGIGHPFTNAVLKHTGSVDFGGLAGSKWIRSAKASSDGGTLFNFTVRVSEQTDKGETVSFKFVPVFVRDDGKIGSGENAIQTGALDLRTHENWPMARVRDAEKLREQAEGHALNECAQYKPWAEDVFCVNALRIEAL